MWPRTVTPNLVWLAVWVAVSLAAAFGGCSGVAVQLAVCQRPVAVKAAVGWVAVGKWT